MKNPELVSKAGLYMEPIERKHRSILSRCHNGCKANADGRLTEMGYRVAEWRAWMIGSPTPLCGPCKKAWEQMWQENLEPVEQEEAVAA